MTSISIDKATFWYDTNSDSTTLDSSAELIETASEYKAVFLKDDWEDSGLPNNAIDWCIVVTDTEGEHYHGEIHHVNYTGETVSVRFPKRQSNIISQQIQNQQP